MKAVCHTYLTHPSHSLIKTICYPEEFSYTSKQTAYGSKNEKKARELYYKIIVKDHIDFQLSESGLVINLKWPVTPKSVPPKIGPARPILAEKPAKTGPPDQFLLPKLVPPLKWLFYPSCIAGCIMTNYIVTYGYI